MRKPKMEMLCDKCGKPQPKDENKSNENWDVFKCNQKCECGGTFKMVIGGQLIG